jgi:hydroxymethylpyrimidine pyrophosphatase-like HAD family hydrolase
MSERSVQLIDEIRRHNVEFAYISGARKSTLLQRLPTLAQADLAIGETGGRIYDKCSAGDGRACVKGAAEEMDPFWTLAVEEISGPMESREGEQLPSPEEREGALWDWYRELLAAGIHADTRAYTCGFRVDLKKQQQQVDEAHAIMQTTMRSKMPPYIACAQNLGKFDFFPALSGKGNACKYVLKKRGFSREQAVALFDDDNDLPMAAECDHCYVMQCTHGKVADHHLSVDHHLLPLSSSHLLSPLTSSPPFPSHLILPPLPSTSPTAPPFHPIRHPSRSPHPR